MANTAASAAQSAPLNNTAMLDGLKHLFESGEWSDLTVVCGDDLSTTFRVHKAILCPRSTFFAGACRGGFSEAISDTIALPEDPDTIKAMLQCAYGIRPPILQHKDYIATRPELAAVAAQLDALMLLFCAVDKYDLEKDVRDDLAASVRVRLEQLQNPLSIVSFACALHERTGERSHDLVDVVARCINDKLFVIVGHKAASERLLSNKSLMKRVLVHAAAANGAMTAYSAYPQGSSALERQLQQDLQSQRQHLARLQLQQRPQRPQQLSSQLAGPQPARQ